MPPAQKTAGAIALILIGLLLTGLGVAIYEVCANPLPAGVTANCAAGPTVLLLFGVICLIAGIAIVVAPAFAGRQTIYPTTDPAVPPPLIRPVVLQETIVQQTVEVRCRYCGSLNAVTATKCSACGAAL